MEYRPERQRPDVQASDAEERREKRLLTSEHQSLHDSSGATSEALCRSKEPGVRLAFYGQGIQNSGSFQVRGNLNIGVQDNSDKDAGFLAALRSTDPSTDRTRIQQEKGGLLEDSYSWILDQADFRRWRDDEQRRLLWIKGDPGKGKTMLLCGITQELEKLPADTHCLSYFFCQATDERLNNATSVLRGLLYLLLDQEPSLISHVRKRFTHAGKGLFEDVNAWWVLSEIIANILQDPNLKRTFLIIDALDECLEGLPQLLDLIIENVSQSPRVKWAVSSRNWPNIEGQLEAVPQHVRLCLELNAKSISAAVSLYIRHKVNKLAQLKIYDDKTRDAVQHYLSSNSNDTFLWVALVCKDLERVPRWNTLAKLKAFPPGLDSLYSSKEMRTIKTSLMNIKQKLTDVQSRDFCSWLERTNPSRRHNDSCALHEDNTGQWVLRASEWKRWVHGPKEFLWIHGIPGAGKTVLLSFLIQEVEAACKGRRQALVYYYCYFVNKQDETVPLLGWLISQLCRLSGKISDEMLQLFLRNHEPNIGQMLLSLETILQEFDTVYLMIDAVDESLPRARLIQVIQDLATDQRFDKVRLLATSRNYTDIETALSPISIQISMMNSLVEQDIRVYVHSSLRSNTRFARWSEDLLLEIEDTLSKGARGMCVNRSFFYSPDVISPSQITITVEGKPKHLYSANSVLKLRFRWAACQISALQRLRLEHDVRIALKSLPKTLDETYERVFLGIPEEDQEIARVAITLICGIDDALIRIVTPVSDQFLIRLVCIVTFNSKLSSNEELFTTHDLLDMCGCLLSLFPDVGDRVQFGLTHYTVKEYLYSERISTGPVSRFAISKSAAAQMFVKAFFTAACQAERWSNDFLKHDLGNFGPFCIVASVDAMAHCEQFVLQDAFLRQLYYDFANPFRPSWPSIRAKCVKAGADSGIVPVYFLELPGNVETGIFVNLISFRVYDLAERFLEDVNDEEIIYQTPISAIFSSDEDIDMIPSTTAVAYANVIDFFADSNAILPWSDEEKVDHYPRLVHITCKLYGPTTALIRYIYFATHKQSSKCSRIHEFINCGADVNARGYRVTPLQIAMWRLHPGAISELLEGGGAVASATGQPDGIAVAAPGDANPPDDVQQIPSHASPRELIGILSGTDLGCANLKDNLIQEIKEYFDKFSTV